MREHDPQRLIWCLGMYASGSTWLFNAVRETAAMLHPGLRIAGHYADDMKPLKSLPANTLNVVKTHDLAGAAAGFMDKGAGRILLSLRDPRDAMTSLMQHMGMNFRQALAYVEGSARFTAGFAADPRACLFIYESGFTEAPETFDTLAAALDGALTPAQREALFAATRRGKIEEKISRIAELPTAFHNPVTDDLVDLDTQWHRHHLGRSGASGRWREALDEAQAAAITDCLGGFMREFGYADTESGG